MTIDTYCGGFCETNGYLVQTDEGSFVIDAPLGMWAYCLEKNVKPTGLLLTHQHFDHVEDAHHFANAQVPLYAASPFQRDLLLEDWVNETIGFPLTVTPYAVDHVLELSGSPLELIGLPIEFRAVPGHSPDSFVFHVALFQKLFGGDTLFAGGGMGRTDFPHSDSALLLRSVCEQLLTLPEDTQVLPGHGPTTTIGQEIVNNPLLARFSNKNGS